MPQCWEPGLPLSSELGAQVSSSPPRPQGSCESPARGRAEAQPWEGPLLRLGPSEAQTGAPAASPPADPRARVGAPQGASTGAGHQQGPSGQAAGLGRGHTLLVLSAHPNPTSL